MADSFGLNGRFELFSIVFKKLSRNLETIGFEALGDRETIYKKVKDKDIVLQKPLPLEGPRRPCSPYDPVYIVFSDHDWIFCIKYKEDDIPIVAVVPDSQSDSVAEVCYQHISDAVDANIVLRYEDEQERTLRISEGEIYATTDGIETTKRVLCSFGSKSNRTTGWYNPDELDHGEPVKLSRSVVALPLGSVLQVTVDLEYSFLGPKPEDKVDYKIKISRDFAVPDSPSKTTVGLSDGRVQFNLSVKWTDDLDERIRLLLDSMRPGVDALYQQLMEEADDVDKPFLFPFNYNVETEIETEMEMGIGTLNEDGEVE